MNSTPDKLLGPAAPSTTAAPTEDLIGEELLTYEVAGDGNWFRMRFTCANGKPGSLSLPTECLALMASCLFQSVAGSWKGSLLELNSVSSSRPMFSKSAISDRRRLCS